MSNMKKRVISMVLVLYMILPTFVFAEEQVELQPSETPIVLEETPDITIEPTTTYPLTQTPEASFSSDADCTDLATDEIVQESVQPEAQGEGEIVPEPLTSPSDGIASTVNGRCDCYERHDHHQSGYYRQHLCSIWVYRNTVWNGHCFRQYIRMGYAEELRGNQCYRYGILSAFQ